MWIKHYFFDQIFNKMKKKLLKNHRRVLTWQNSLNDIFPSLSMSASVIVLSAILSS